MPGTARARPPTVRAASRSDDVTILLIMGDQDQMTDAMKTSVLWVMAEWERRLGRKLRRTHHGALTQTDCPGPEATAWSRAGFPAPNATTPTIQEDDMPLSDDDLKKIYSAVWNGGPGMDLIPQYAEGGGAWPSTILGAATARIAQQVAPLRGEIAGLTAALQSITAGQGLDLDAVKHAVAAAVAESLAGLDADVTLTVKEA